MNKGVIVSLCDLTGAMVAPWTASGYDAVLVDPQHERYTIERMTSGATVERIPQTILVAAQRLGEILRGRSVVFVAGFPPCTDVSVSGARWFAAKAEQDKHFQAKAAMVAEQCRMVGELSGAPWFFENPVSVFSGIFGKPDHTFNPHDFTALCPDDNYRKLTCLWSGGGFCMPPPCRLDGLPGPDDRINKAPPGPDRANFRSATPAGFAIAVFLANAPHMKRQLTLFDSAE